MVREAWAQERKTLIQLQSEVKVDYLRQSRRVVKTVETEANHQAQRKWEKKVERGMLQKQLAILEKKIEAMRTVQKGIIDKLEDRKQERTRLLMLLRKGAVDQNSLAAFSSSKLREMEFRRMNFERHLSVRSKESAKGFSCTAGSTFSQSNPHLYRKVNSRGHYCGVSNNNENTSINHDVSNVIDDPPILLELLQKAKKMSRKGVGSQSLNNLHSTAHASQRHPLSNSLGINHK